MGDENPKTRGVSNSPCFLALLLLFEEFLNQESLRLGYIKSASLNGKPLDRPWISHDEISGGGTLVLEMGNAPSEWGSKPEMAPPSMSDKL